MSILCGCCYFITIFRTHLELFEVLSLSYLMYKYFCKLSLGLKFGEFYFGFTGYNMPMIKASRIWNKVSLSPLVILVKQVSPRWLKQLIIQFKVLNINCYSFSHLFNTQCELLNIQITHSHRYNSADLQIANKTIIK